MNYLFILFPVIGAFVGWIIHLVASKLIVSRIAAGKTKMAHELGTYASAEFNKFDLESSINNPEHLENVFPMIETHIDHFLNEKLKEEMPMISMFISSKTTGKLKEVFMKEIRTLFPDVISKFAGNIKQGIDLDQMIISKVEAISTQEVESIIRKRFSKELNLFCVLGAVTGFVVGLLQLLLTALL
jgi:uncharacterized membrane protein YheB (UPF0754 family)